MSKPTREEVIKIDNLLRKERIMFETNSYPKDEFEWKEFWRDETLKGDIRIRQLEANIEKQTLELESQKRIMLRCIEDLEAEIVCLKAEVQEGVIRNDNLHRVFSAKYEECMQLKTEKEALEEAMKQAFKAARQEVAEGPFFSDRRLYPTFEDWQRSREK